MWRLRYLIATAMLVCSVLSNVAGREAQQPETPPTIKASYAAKAFPQSGSTMGRTFGLTVTIEGLTSEGEIQELVGTLKSKGQDGLLNSIEDMRDKGRVAPTGSVGTGVRVVRIRPNKNGGQHIVLLTDRPIGFAELRNSTRSRDYPFGIVVLDVDKDGKGTGLMALACKIKFNKKNELEVEHYGQKPYRLANVYRHD